MLVMVIEAMKQSINSVQHLVGFNIKDTFFQAALAIPLDRAGVEVQLTLLSSPRSSDKNIPWSDFRLYSLADNDCVLICHGSIQPQYEDNGAEVDGGREISEHWKACKLLHETQSESCVEAINTEAMYRQLRFSGMEFGPAFRRLDDMSCNNKGDAIGKIKLFQWTTERGTNHPQPHIIHPASLDAVFQMMFVAMSAGGTKDMPTMMTTRIHKLFVSCKGLSYPAVESLTVCANSLSGDSRSIASVIALDSSSQKPLIFVDGVEATTVASARSRQSQIRDVMSYAVNWKPDFEILSSKQQTEYCEGSEELAPEPVEFFKNLQFCMMAYITEALKVVDRQKLAEPHYQNYFAWMEAQAERFDAGTLAGYLPEWSSLLWDHQHRDTLTAKLSQINVQGQTYMEIGRNLVNILQGSVDPLAILFQTGLASEFYEEVFNAARFFKPMTIYLQTLVHKRPNMKILEIGAGTGAMTRHVLNSLMPATGDKEFGTPLYSTYDFTDISRSFFTQARVEFAHHDWHLNFGILDIDKDPEAQGWGCGVYDMVIASSVS
jgi:hypothetical protein